MDMLLDVVTNQQAYPLHNGTSTSIYDFPGMEDLEGGFQSVHRSEVIPATIILHRGNIFHEMIQAFKTHAHYELNKMKIEMILPNGTPENAEDIGGVLRDTITEFWQSFYDKCTVGTSFKVPVLRHDFAEAEWSAAAKILVGGWEAEGYFPIKLAPVFIKNCLGIETNAEELLNNFFKYISTSEAQILRAALENFESVDFDELLEFFADHDSKWKPSKDNLKKLIHDIAHKDLVQKPAFIVNCFKTKLFLLKNEVNLEHIYRDLEPSVKNILNKLNLESDLKAQESVIFYYLKKFIRESDEKNRSAFLRFVTGSDIAGKTIHVAFISTTGISRSPISHTCACLLELPTSYENFITFRNEFTNILTSNVWIMDIV